MTIPVEIKCPECGSPMTLTKGILGKSFFRCSRWPECDGAHGAHPDGTPMGIPANFETKQARRSAHAALDEVRNILRLTKSQTYRWLQSVLKLSQAECHIGLFDKAMCDKVIDECNKAVSGLGSPF